MCQPVLVPLDGSPEAEAALDALARLAIDPDEVILVQVVTPIPAGVAAMDPHQSAGPAHLAAEAYLASVRDRLAETHPRCVAEVVEGDPRVQILVAAKRHGCVLIAMTAPEGGISDRILFGSLAGRVAGASPAPLLLAPRRASRQRSCPITRVLVPLDGSAVAEDAIPAAVEVADRLRAELALVESVDAAPFTSPLGERLAPELYERLRSGLADQASHYLRRVAEEWTRPGRFVSWTVLEGSPHLRIAQETGPGDLVVTAVPIRNGLARWLPDSMVETLARESEALLLLTPSATVPRLSLG